MDGLLPVMIQALAGIAEGQARIEAKLDALREALAEESDDELVTVQTLDDPELRRIPCSPTGAL